MDAGGLGDRVGVGMGMGMGMWAWMHIGTRRVLGGY